MEFPGPQPRSMMWEGGETRGILARRSWTGRVRWSANLRYWVEDQSVEGEGWEGEGDVVKVCFPRRKGEVGCFILSLDE